MIFLKHNSDHVISLFINLPGVSRVPQVDPKFSTCLWQQASYSGLCTIPLLVFSHFSVFVVCFFSISLFYLHRIVFLHFNACLPPEVPPLVSFLADLDSVPLSSAPLAPSPFLLLSRLMLLGATYVTSNKHHLMNESSLFFISTAPEKFTIREFLPLPLNENTAGPLIVVIHLRKTKYNFVIFSVKIQTPLRV